jgi:hypothetical protein
VNLSLKKGTKADDNAPSAKKALKRLGIAKATKNTSVTLDAPKKAATTTSLIKPQILLKDTAILDLYTDELKLLDVKKSPEF